METFTIDAKDKKLGRVASEAASILMGKNRPDFARHKLADHQVKIINASKVDIDSKKRSEKIYQIYSGHPGGRRLVPLERLIKTKGYEEVFQKAIKGMLPNNKLRAKMLKHLIVTD